jgi:16S rRNA (guanine527-N7)-methyltransferase
MTTSKTIKDFSDFITLASYFGIEVNNNQLNKFKKYYEILLDWNTKINLISRASLKHTDGENDTVLEKHFLDSIIFLPEIEGLKDQVPRVFDIGSGGGFPGIPLAIMKPEWHFTLAESVTKKATFLRTLIKELELKNAEVINERVEKLNQESKFKEKYDIVTARAITNLTELIKYALPLLKPKGFLAAYKSKDIDLELKEATKIINKNKLKLKIFSKELNGIQRKLITLSCSDIF